MTSLLQAVPTNIITGFLGAGKTTLIKHLLATKPAHERWAVLVNEFGQIGIDQALMGQTQEVFIKEVAGGCICCANFLPMQVALSQLLAKARPQRLLIEPTGLGHPKQMIESLSESHWQSTLSLQATLCVIDARQYQDERIRQHESFMAQTHVADVLVFSKNELLNEEQRNNMINFVQTLPTPQPQYVFIQQGQLDLAYLTAKRASTPPIKRSLLHDYQRMLANPPINNEAIQAPYHYHQQALESVVGGWVFPPEWQFEHNRCLDVLFSWQYQRIKGIIHTTQGWLAINLTPLDATITSCVPSLDTRLEVISSDEIAWPILEAELLSTRQA